MFLIKTALIEELDPTIIISATAIREHSPKFQRERERGVPN